MMCKIPCPICNEELVIDENNEFYCKRCESSMKDFIRFENKMWNEHLEKISTPTGRNFFDKSEEEKCEHCDTDESDIIFKNYEGKYIFRVENSNWDYYNDGFDYTDIEINYCPFCGRKLV